MKVLITGGAGFIGSHTADLLLERGYEVRILDGLEPPVHPRRERPLYLPREAEFIEGDIRDKFAWEKALEGVEAVIHLAAYQDYLPDFGKFAMVNDGGTALLYEVIVERRLPVKKIVLGSSQAVYGESKYECPRDGVQYPPPRSLEQLKKGEWEVKCPICSGEMRPLPADESQVNPHNQYAVSKYAQELYALTLGRRYDIPTVVLRYGIVQGPRQSFHNAYSGILRIFTLRLLNDLPPVIYEDGLQLRDYVYVGDVAQANLMALEREDMDFEVYNVAGGRPITVLEYAELLTKVIGKTQEPLIPGEFRYGDVRHIFSDISKIKALDWEPQTPLEQIMRKYVEWASMQPDARDFYQEAEKVMKERQVLRGAK